MARRYVAEPTNPVGPEEFGRWVCGHASVCGIATGLLGRPVLHLFGPNQSSTQIPEPGDVSKLCSSLS